MRPETGARGSCAPRARSGPAAWPSSLDLFLRRAERVAALAATTRRVDQAKRAPCAGRAGCAGRACRGLGVGCADHAPDIDREACVNHGSRVNPVFRAAPFFLNALIPIARYVELTRDTGRDGRDRITDLGAHARRSLARLAAIAGRAGPGGTPARVAVYDRHVLDRILRGFALRGRSPDRALVMAIQTLFLEVCDSALTAGAGPIPEVSACFSLDADTLDIRDHAFLESVARLNARRGFIVLCREDALSRPETGPEAGLGPRFSEAVAEPDGPLANPDAPRPGILEQIRVLARRAALSIEREVPRLVPERPVTEVAVMRALIAHALRSGAARFSIAPQGADAFEGEEHEKGQNPRVPSGCASQRGTCRGPGPAVSGTVPAPGSGRAGHLDVRGQARSGARPYRGAAGQGARR